MIKVIRVLANAVVVLLQPLLCELRVAVPAGCAPPHPARVATKFHRCRGARAVRQKTRGG